MTESYTSPSKRIKLDDSTNISDQTESISTEPQQMEYNNANIETDEISNSRKLIEETEILFSKDNLLKAFNTLDELIQKKNVLLPINDEFTNSQENIEQKEDNHMEDEPISDELDESILENLSVIYNEILEFLTKFDYLLFSQHPETLETVCHWLIRRGHDKYHSYNDLLKTLIGELGATWNFVDKEENSLGDLLIQRNNLDLYNWLVDHGVKVELILRCVGKKSQLPFTITAKDEEIDHDDYLKQKLIFKDDVILDADGNGVMMGWERPLMEVHAQILCSPLTSFQTQHQIEESSPNLQLNQDSKEDTSSVHESLPSLEEMELPEGLAIPQTYSVLNVGFGLGIIDSLIQSYHPTTHVIIEAHPDVYAKMIEDAWDKKSGVKILFGKWQDFVEEIQEFDAIFFDTYGENYDALAQFNEYLPKILKKTGIYSFFNGLAARNILFHDVACQVVVSDLASLGISTDFLTMDMELDDEEWIETRDQYWKLKEYRVPVCTFDSDDKKVEL